MAGAKFLHVSGDLIFEPHVLRRTIEVPLLNDDLFDSTLEFEVVLTNPRDTHLGKYLYHCRVRVTVAKLTL